MRVNLSTAIAMSAIVGAGAFAAGRAIEPAPAVSPIEPSPTMAMPPSTADTEELPPDHPAIGRDGIGEGSAAPSQALPPGHPRIDGTGGGSVGSMGSMPAGGFQAPTGEPSLVWKAPTRWQSIPNPSTMRLATYRVPRAADDTEDAELSVTQAGGSVDANAARWIGQFDTEAQKGAKRTTRTVGGLDVTIVAVQGSYSDTMGAAPKTSAGKALLGAIVATPGMPYFFKLTGPVKSVLAARAEFDAMIGSLTPR